MSLTHHTEDRQSPVYTFMSENLPDLVARNSELRLAYRQSIPDEETITLPDEYKHLASLAGGAIERRLTWSCNNDLDSGPHLGGIAIVASHQRWLSSGNEKWRLAADAAKRVDHAVISYATSMTGQYDTDNRSMPISRGYQQESLLIRGAFGIAQLDAAQHSGGASLTERFFLGNPIADPTDTTTIGEGLVSVLSEIPEALIDDVYDQLDLATESGFADMRKRSSVASTKVTPTFEGSESVGGADADLIIDGQLLDIKSTYKVRELPSSELRQLVGYLLLDTSDVYGIDALGLYRTRNGHLFSVETSDFLRMAGSTERLPVLREKFAEQVLAPLDTRRQAMLKLTQRDREYFAQR